MHTYQWTWYDNPMTFFIRPGNNWPKGWNQKPRCGLVRDSETDMTSLKVETCSTSVYYIWLVVGGG